MVKNYKDIIDAGLNLDFPGVGFNVQSMYHSNSNLSVGAGIGVKQVNFLFNYNIETGQLNKYTNGTFELALHFQVFNK